MTLFIAIDNPISYVRAMDSNLESIENWSKLWLVTFNTLKTNSMLITKKCLQIQYPNITFCGTTCDNISKENIDIVINSDLSPSGHINIVVSKAMKLIGVMKMLKHNLSRRSL